MSSLPSCFLGENAIIRHPPLTPQSACGSSYRRLHNPCSGSSKAWGLRNDANTPNARTYYQGAMLSLYSSCTVRSRNNRLNLHASNRPKVTYRLLVCQSHRTGYCSNSNSVALSTFRRNNSYNCTRPNIFRHILSRKYHLRTNPQPNYTPNARDTTGSPTNIHLVTRRRPRQPSPPSTS